jgi:hypothetical protein
MSPLIPYNPFRHEERRLIVECPRCRARYTCRVRSARPGPDVQMLAVCSHIFAHEAQSDIAPEAAPQRPLDPPLSPARHTESRREPAQHEAESLAFTFSSVAQPAAAFDRNDACASAASASPSRITGSGLFVRRRRGSMRRRASSTASPSPRVDPDDEPRFVRGEDDFARRARARRLHGTSLPRLSHRNW